MCTHALSGQEGQALLSINEWVIHCMVAQLPVSTRYLEIRDLTPFLGSMWKERKGKAWKSGVAALFCCLQDLWGCERLVLQHCVA